MGLDVTTDSVPRKGTDRHIDPTRAVSGTAYAGWSVPQGNRPLSCLRISLRGNIMKCVSRLWNEEVGAVLSAEVMLVASILVIGVIAGLASLRDSVVTEL